MVLNAKKEVFPLSTWGKRVKHSQGKECLCSHCKINSTLAASSSAYSGVYPATPAVLAVPTGTWRDGAGVVIEVHPVSVDHAKGAVEVLHGADIKWGMTLTIEDPKPLVVDPAFYDAYSHVFDNGEHQAHEYVAGASGRVLVIYEAQYQSLAQTYSNLIKLRGFSSVLMLKGSGSSSSIKSTISGLYNAKGPSPTSTPPAPTPPTPPTPTLPTSSPVPTPSPTPSPAPGSCHAISPLATDATTTAAATRGAMSTAAAASAAVGRSCGD